MTEYLTQNARVVEATILIDDHGCLTSWLHLRLADGCSQGFGGYPMVISGKPLSHLSSWVSGILTVTESSEWSKVAGKNVRVRSLDCNGRLLAIGHILDDVWFTPEEDLGRDPVL